MEVGHRRKFVGETKHEAMIRRVTGNISDVTLLAKTQCQQDLFCGTGCELGTCGSGFVTKHNQTGIGRREGQRLEEKIPRHFWRLVGGRFIGGMGIEGLAHIHLKELEEPTF